MVTLVGDVGLGILAIAAGAILCIGGAVALRLAISVWGAFVGFSLGAGLIAALTDERVLAKPLGWVLGLVLAMVFGALAYLYYQVGVVLAAASFGFGLGVSAMVALGVSWNWLILVVALTLGVLVAGVAIRRDLPALLLVVVSAIAGATAVVAGAMLLTGELDRADLSNRRAPELIADDWWWYGLYLAVLVASVVIQQGAHVWSADQRRWSDDRPPGPAGRR